MNRVFVAGTRSAETRRIGRMRNRGIGVPAKVDDDRRSAACRVVLVEDDKPVRDRFANILQQWEGGHLVAACATLSDVTATIRNEAIDLLIADLNLPDGHGVQSIRLLRASQPHAEAMVISVLADEDNVINAIEAGASGYLLKDSDPIDIIEAITDVLAGRSPISSTIARTLVRRLSGRKAAELPSDDGEMPKLTPREMDVLWGIAKGFTYGELADRLAISRQTVPVHIRHIYRKLQATNRSEAVYEASRRGLIRL